MTVIADIRIYRCTVENVTGVKPDAIDLEGKCKVRFV